VNEPDANAPNTATAKGRPLPDISRDAYLRILTNNTAESHHLPVRNQ
jgi:hypothetical protein